MGRKEKRQENARCEGGEDKERLEDKDIGGVEEEGEGRELEKRK